MMELNKQLSRLRKERGISQLDLAEKLEVSRQTISRWEAGVSVPTAENLVRLSALYGVPPDGLVGDVRTPPGPPEVADAGETRTGPEKAAEEKRPKRSRKRALLIALLLAVGLIIGGLFYLSHQHSPVRMDDLEGEVIDIWDGEMISFLD